MNAPNNDLLLAQQWLARLGFQDGALAGMGPAEMPLPARWIDAAASLVGLVMAEGKSLQIVVPDDETLPELSNALDIDLRPLCLVLPEADFATRIALRATLTLLKSRLARHADTHPVWEAQRRRMERLAGTWADAQTWGRSETEAPWPADIGHLFPARLLPASHALDLAVPADVQLLVAPERMPAEARDALVLHGRVLCLSAAMRGAEQRRVVVFDEVARQRLELDILTREIAELELELATAQAEIADFTQRYAATVGKRVVELDALHAEIAQVQAERQPADMALRQTAQETHAQAEQSRTEQQRFEDIPRQAAEKVFAPSRDLKKLYRQIAQKIHPDRADNDDDRKWRTQLMAEATRAYRIEDEAALREVLNQWRDGPQAVPGAVTGPRSSLAEQVARLRGRLDKIQAELDRLLGSRLYELLVATRLAQRQGRDLLQEMSASVDLQADAARMRLDELNGAAA